ncbi:PIN domain-containing protein [Moraxella atlantae]|uniref:PIN domain-containing protein n=1 Tax=Faucicola atlantae TaxID=34059 RepID=UPI003753B663
MNGINFLLDTCFIIGLYNGDNAVLEVIEAKQIMLTDCAISPINRMEILGYRGLTADDTANLTRLLDNLLSLPISRQVENKTIELRKRHQIKLPDSIVLATAISHNVQLLTLDNGLARKYQAEVSGD